MRRALLLGVLLAGLAAEPVLAQCAMCKTALTGSPEGQRISAEFNRAILVMFFAPYVVLGAFLAAIFREKIAERARYAAVALRERLRRHGPLVPSPSPSQRP